MAGALVVTLTLALLSACSSNPPPAPPRAAAEAERLAHLAARLQREDNWPGAAETWNRAARQYRLLHREDDTAQAEHNEALARRALGQPEAARSLLESAAASNHARSRAQAWWRNQIALLQLDVDTAPTQARERLDRLLPRLDEIRSLPELTALLHHEEARLHGAQDRPDLALAALARAETEFSAASDAQGLAAIALTRARILQSQQDPRAIDTWKEALGRFEALGHPRGVALALAGWGTALSQSPKAADRTQARAILSQALANLKVLGLQREAEAAAHVLAGPDAPSPGTP